MEAVTIAGWSVGIAPAAFAVKLPVEAPLVINNPEGVVRLVLLLLSDTTLHPTEGFDSVTVQVLVPPPFKLEGTHAIELGVTDATRSIVTLEELLPRVAVTVED